MMTDREYSFLSSALAEKISDRCEVFEVKMNGLLWSFNITFTEDWSEPYAAVEFMGDREWTADYFGTTINDLTFYGAWKEDGEEVMVSVDTDRLKKEIEKRLEA